MYQPILQKEEKETNESKNKLRKLRLNRRKSLQKIRNTTLLKDRSTGLLTRKNRGELSIRGERPRARIKCSYVLSLNFTFSSELRVSEKFLPKRRRLCSYSDLDRLEMLFSSGTTPRP